MQKEANPFFHHRPSGHWKKNFRVAHSGDLARDIRSAAPSLKLADECEHLLSPFALAVFLNASVGGFYALRAIDVVVVARRACFFCL